MAQRRSLNFTNVAEFWINDILKWRVKDLTGAALTTCDKTQWRKSATSPQRSLLIVDTKKNSAE